MRFAVMQPYFFPYLGYFHLIHAVDVLVLADDYQYSKSSWVNRNRIMNRGEVKTITLPLNRDTDYALINQRTIADSFKWSKNANILKNAYERSENFEDIYELYNDNVFVPGTNLHSALEESLYLTLEKLQIETEIMNTSDFKLPREMKGKEKIFQIARELDFNEYLNLPGGRPLYTFPEFSQEKLKLGFIESKFASYLQDSEQFISHLSILDLIARIGIHSDMRMQIANYEVSYS